MDFFNELNLWRAKRVYSDNYVCYADVVGATRLRQGKKNTYTIKNLITLLWNHIMLIVAITIGIVKKCAVREYPKSWIGRSQAAW